MPEWTTVFGYRHVTGVPFCPCGDPGNYLSMEQVTGDPLTIRFRCWCGRTVNGNFDDAAERAEFLIKNGVRT